MKAKLKVLLPGFTGNMDDVVIYYNSKLGKYIARKKVKPHVYTGILATIRFEEQV